MSSTAGFNASRTHFTGTGFKTDAGFEKINEILTKVTFKECSKFMVKYANDQISNRTKRKIDR